MAKKRKLDSGSSLALRPPPQPVVQEEQVIEEENPEEEEQVIEEEDLEEEEEIEYEEELEEEEEEENEVEEEEEEEEETKDAKSAEGADRDEGPLQTVLASFSKEALISLLCDAAERHPDVAEKVRESAETDTSRRKIFVHGLKWDTSSEMLSKAFLKYGEIEDCRLVTDKTTGKSKGYGFILFKSSRSARAALKEPQKMINNRMTACQLASLGPVISSPQQLQSELTQRKIYVSNVGPELDPEKLKVFFSQYGEIEEGPLGLDKKTGKPRGFCLFVYKTVQSANWALTQPYKQFEGVGLRCRKAIDGRKSQKGQMTQTPKPQIQNQHLLNNVAPAGNLMAPLVQQQGLNLNPAALRQALTTLMAAQGEGLNLFGAIGAGNGLVNNPGFVGNQVAQGVYGNQGVGSGMNNSVNAVGGFGNQAGFPQQQKGRGFGGRSQYGGKPYRGR